MKVCETEVEIDQRRQIKSVLRCFKTSVIVANREREDYCDEKKVVNELNIKALNLLQEYSKFTGDDEIPAVFAVLNAMQEKSPITFGHSIVEAAIAMELLEALKVEKSFEEYWKLYKGYLLHDIGKLDPTIIDLVNDPNEKDEIREEIKKHVDPTVVRKMMNYYRITSEIVFKIAIAHHLRPDGTGYPIKSSHPNIDFIENKYTEVASLADMIEAIMYNLVTNREYKKKSTLYKLHDILVEIRGKQIRSDICDIGIAYVCKLISVSYPSLSTRHVLTC